MTVTTTLKLKMTSGNDKLGQREWRYSARGGGDFGSKKGGVSGQRNAANFYGRRMDKQWRKLRLTLVRGKRGWGGKRKVSEKKLASDFEPRSGRYDDADKQGKRMRESYLTKPVQRKDLMQARSAGAGEGKITRQRGICLISMGWAALH